jgi:hypothetical protein
MTSNLSRRRFVQTVSAASVLTTSIPRRAHAQSSNEVRLGFIGCGSRAGEHLQYFSKLDGIKIAGLCDPDASKVNAARSIGPDAKTFSDLRALLDDKDIDAVVVAACNHWHCLAAIWAMQAGKHVYVEKPLSHSQWEGRQTVAAARKYNRVCQVGTQQRSDPMQAEIKQFLHKEKGLGEILSARVNRYGVRASIGKRDTPLAIDPNLDYDLWLGPAQDKPIYRSKLHYDWHWDWNTGSGEMGNWGVHVLDDLRNNVFEDKVTLPKRIFGGGGRVVWDDAGETPNVHFVYFDTGSIPVVIGLSNLPESPKSSKPPKPAGPNSGYVAYCEGGRLEGQRGSAVAYDKDGKQIKKFKGGGGNGLHHKNFIEAVRKGDASILNTDVEVGHHSTGWCNLANIAFRTGAAFDMDKANQLDNKEWRGMVDEMKQHLAAHSLDINDCGMKLGPMLSIDAEKEVFIGEHAEQANQLLKREYRSSFVVPEIV